MNLAYLTVTFPSNSETFVLREINYFMNQSSFEKLCVFAYKKPDNSRINKDNLEWMDKAVYTKRRYLFNLMAVVYYFFTRFRSVCTIFGLWIKEIPSLSIQMNIKVLAHMLTGFGVARRIQKEDVDHMHAHFSTASTIAFIAHVLTGVPFSFTAHASGDIYVYSPFLFEKIKNSKRIIAVSEYNKKYLELICNYEVDSDKIKVLYNGVSVPDTFERRPNNEIPVIFMSASFTGFKGYGTLIKSLKILKDNKVPYIFFSAGNGPLYNQIKEIISKEGLKDEVRLLGYQPLSVVKEYFEKAAIFVFPSEVYIDGQRDGMPTAITEAMSYGLPIVATYITGIPEQVENGSNGFLVPERNEEELADKLEILLRNEELRNQMGLRSYEIAKNKFNIEITMNKLAMIFNDSR